MRRSRRIPLPLLAVLAVVLVEGLAWTFAVPALQGADEGAHFSYVQEIADGGQIPWTDNPYLPSPELPMAQSSEHDAARRWAGLEPLRGNRAARPLWTETDEEIWRERDARLGPDAKTDAVGVPAWRNPPLYYLSAAVPYEIAGGSLFDRLYALRLYNVVLLLAIVGLTWLLAGEVFGRRRALQTVAAAVVALHPTLLDVTTRVTPDALLIALSAAVLYLMAVIVRRGPEWRLVVLLALAVTAAAFTQGRALGLVAPALLAVGVAWWRRRGRRRADTMGAAAHPSRVPVGGIVAGVGAATLALLVVVGYYATRFDLGEIAGFWSYLWQFYLPALPGMSQPVGPAWGVEQVYLDRFLATFVQFEVGFPQDLRDLLRFGIFAGLIVLVVALVRHRDVVRARWDVAVVLVATFLLGMLALHAAAFRDLLLNPDDPIITGRYLLPFLPLLGVAAAAATTALPGRVRAFGTGALVASLALLQLSALGVVVARFYA